MARFLVTVHEESYRVYVVEADDEDAAYALEPAEFSDEMLHDDLGGDIHISDVKPMDAGEE